MTTIIDRETSTSKKKQRLPRYQVVMCNDDFTPMYFVEGALRKHFAKPAEEAHSLMLQVHMRGRAIAGVFTKEIATHKAAAVMDEAKAEGHPFRLECQPV